MTIVVAGTLSFVFQQEVMAIMSSDTSKIVLLLLVAGAAGAINLVNQSYRGWDACGGLFGTACGINWDGDRDR